jgi:phytoene dehydrogenase-like protein
VAAHGEGACSAWFVDLGTLRRAGGRAAAYEGLVEAGREAVFRAFREAGVGDIRPHLVQETVRTPVDWQDMYGLQYGAAFGLDHGLDQLSVFRPSNKDSKVSLSSLR